MYIIIYVSIIILIYLGECGRRDFCSGVCWVVFSVICLIKWTVVIWLVFNLIINYLKKLPSI